MKFLFSFIFLWTLESQAAPWPDFPWLNRIPQTNAVASVMAFISPYDLQFYRVMNIWRKLEKKYTDQQLNFIIVAIGEPSLPGTDEVVRNILKEYNYTSPVLLDLNSNYAKQWKAYVSPSVNMIGHDGKVTSFDPGNFDPALFEKNLQKTLKENKLTVPPNREFSNDGEVKSCSHSRTYFFGEKFGKAWGSDVFTTQGAWLIHPYWLEGTDSNNSSVEVNAARGAVGVLAEAVGTTAKVSVSLDGAKVPLDLRGKDITEDKNGNTVVIVRNLKMYEAISHSAHIRESGQKLTLATDSKGLKLRALQILPPCLEVD